MHVRRHPATPTLPPGLAAYNLLAAGLGNVAA